jgi:hypothetical protein
VNERVIFYLTIIFQNKLNVVMDDESDNTSISMIESQEEEEQQESHQTTISIQPTTRSNSKTAKKKGVFKTEWTSLKEFSSWIQEVKGDSFRKPFYLKNSNLNVKKLETSFPKFFRIRAKKFRFLRF